MGAIKFVHDAQTAKSCLFRLENQIRNTSPKHLVSSLHVDCFYTALMFTKQHKTTNVITLYGTIEQLLVGVQMASYHEMKDIYICLTLVEFEVIANATSFVAGWQMEQVNKHEKEQIFR